jgi:murein DD-endopeptidase MepM/ murein hydrolase activator NlpD
LIFSLIFLSLPANSQASVFLFVNRLFAETKAADVSSSLVNSQKMPLLEPALNSNPTLKKKNSALAVENGALVADASPAGRANDSAVATSPSSDQISLYTVRDGDTLPGIAKLYSVSVNTILWANDLKKGALIKPGQVLVILPVSGVEYTVKKGDTVQSIAKQFKGDAQEIASFNNLNTDQKLSVGDQLIIPDGEMSSGGNSSTSSSKPSTSIPEISVPIISPTTPNSPAPAISSSEAAGPTNGPYVDSTGYLRRPLDGGMRSQGLHGHNAVDWADPIGTPIHAAAAGTIIVSKDNGGWNGGYGDYVVISHNNGMQTLYAHMKETTVGVGTHVEKGQVIGYVGMTGDTSGPHVHFEVRGGKNPF